MHRRTLFAAVAIAFGVALTLYWGSPRMNLDPPQLLVIGFLDDIRAVHDQTGRPLDMGVERPRQDDDVVFFEARASAKSGPDGYVVRIVSDKCGPVTLPAGRMVVVDHVGPWVSAASATLPMEPLAFPEARAMAERIMDEMMDAGWERTYHRPEFDEARIAEIMGKRHTLARLEVCGDPGTYAEVTVRSYGDGAPGFSVPPMAVGRALPEDEPIRYLIRVAVLGRNFSDETPNLIDAREALVRARRKETTGNPNKPLPLTVWLDDPDWRPSTQN